MSNTPHQHDSTNLDMIFVEQAMRYQDGSLTPDELVAFEAKLRENLDRLREFAELQIQSAMVQGAFQQQAYEVPQPLASRHRSSLLKLTSWGWPVATTLLLGWGMWLYANRSHSIAKHEQPQPGPSVPQQVASQDDVRLAGSSQATFFGELVPRNSSVLELRRDYVLTGGLVELSFPTGASAIIEAPAVFRILDREGLALDTGRCSVHAPDGAEGFRLETPFNRVVDRGTRFTVNVSDNSETEVQVIEGLADVYRKSAVALLPETPSAEKQDVGSPSELPLEVRLADREARRFVGTESATAHELPFVPGKYRQQLPDRIVSYEATTDARGGALKLQSVTVQRDGIEAIYPVDDLIPVSLTWFKSFEATDPNGHLTGGAELPEQRGNWLRDQLLTTGVINPGGQSAPLVNDPVMQEVESPTQANTPGFAVRFDEPVINGPGPEIVFFELQSLTNPPGGDSFHVSPLKFRPGLHSSTVAMYDLTIASPEALSLGGFYLYRGEASVESLHMLESAEFTRTHVRLGFRGLAVGIDLSDLGYATGEQVEGLFFQDADDDSHRVDPVFIAGLPAAVQQAAKPNQ